MSLMNPLAHDEWVDLYTKLVRYDTELEGDEGARQILDDQFREANRAFGRYVEDHYRDWIADADTPPDDDRPVLSHEVVPQYVLPKLSANQPVLFFVIDCMRYDQWLEFRTAPLPPLQHRQDVSLRPPPYGDAVLAQRNFQRPPLPGTSPSAIRKCGLPARTMNTAATAMKRSSSATS